MFAQHPKLTGFLFAILSAATFGSSGVLAKGLILSGWSPAAVVIGRIAIGGLVLFIPAIRSLGGRYHLLKGGWPILVFFGAFTIATSQLAYFMAVERLNVAVALLLLYLGVLLVVVWEWFVHKQPPKRLTIIGSIAAMFGLVFVLNLFGGVTIDGLGVMFALLGAVGLASHFIVSATDSHGLPPLVFASGGLLIGTLTLSTFGALGVLPMSYSFAPVLYGGFAVPWWLAFTALGIIAAAISYVTGIVAARSLGPKMASFVGLSEVLFSVVWAWTLLGEMPLPVQLGGGALILAGVVLVKVDEDTLPAVALAES